MPKKTKKKAARKKPREAFIATYCQSPEGFIEELFRVEIPTPFAEAVEKIKKKVTLLKLKTPSPKPDAFANFLNQPTEPLG